MRLYAHTVFCEDIREEAGGKISIMGVLGRRLRLPRTPIVLPKLGLITWFPLPQGREPVEIRYTVLFNDVVVVEEVIPDKSTPSYEERVEGQVRAMLAPFEVENPGTLRVRVRVGDQEEVEAGSLNIIVQQVEHTASGDIAHPQANRT